MDSHEQWMADVEDALQELRSSSVQWWVELRGWCNSVQFRVVQDMVFHDKHMWMQTWVIRDRPSEYYAPHCRLRTVARILRGLGHRIRLFEAR